MERYSSYKDSGISWLGDIPEHWEVRRFKSFFSVANGNGFKIEYQGMDSGDFPFLKVSDLNGKSKFVSGANNYVTEQISINESYKIIPAGSILFSKIGEALKKNHRKINTVSCCIDNNCSALVRKESITEKIDINFAYYVMRCVDMTWFDNGGTIPCVNMKKFMTSSFSLPPLSEQEQIVSYLEDKTSKIDAYVSDKEKEIELLQELKQKTIADAVTKGLNPDAKMKDSKTSLFGQIPYHWEERKMKYCFSERSEKNHPEEPILCATQSQGVIPQSMYQNRVVVVNKGFEGLKFVKAGDFVISLRSFEGGIEYAYYQGIISAAYTILTPLNANNTDYFKFLFKSNPFIQVLQTCVTGIREGQNINYQVLGRKFLPLPPSDEQQAIVTYIEEKCQKIDKLASELQSEIDYLKEYKQRLIADCVTGQVNVQNI